MAKFDPYPYGYSSSIVTSGSSYYITTSSSSTGYATITGPPAPAREPTALEWLDAEVERTCARARL